MKEELKEATDTNHMNCNNNTNKNSDDSNKKKRQMLRPRSLSPEYRKKFRLRNNDREPEIKNISEVNASLLISAVRKRPQLWDRNNVNYNKNKKQAVVIWDNIARELGAKREIVKSKWKSLRNNFSKILYRSRKTGHLNSSWTHFKQMQFLRNQIEANASMYLNNNQLNQNDDGSSEGDKNNPEVILMEDEENEVSIRSQHRYYTRNVEPRHYREMDSPQSIAADDACEADVYVYGSKRNNMHDNVQQRDQDEQQEQQTFPELHIYEKSNNVRKSIPNCSNNLNHCCSHRCDDDYHYVMSFLPHMKSMPPKTKLWFRMQIQNLLYECLDSSQSHYLDDGNNCGNSIGTNRHIGTRTILIKESPNSDVYS